MIQKVRDFFEFQNHATDIKTEIVAGLSTFLALAYIFVVNPSILSEGGINKSAALFATVIISSFATIIMGLWAKKPFALAPGLEINSYVVYFLIIGMGISWQESLGIVFWSGIIFLILTITNIRVSIINAIPDSLKVGLSAAVGVFLIIIALRLSDILVYDKTKISGISNPISYKGMILFLGLTIALFFHFYKSRYFILLSIITCSFIAHFVGLVNDSKAYAVLSVEMFLAIGKLDISVITNPKMLSPILILFVLDFYGSIAKFIGLTKNTSIMKNGEFPKMKEALMIDGTATTIGAVLGTTSIVAFVESGVGIGAGGRTGLTAVVCGLLMLLFIPLAPIINLVPVIATTGALLWVGVQLMPDVRTIKLMPKIELYSIIFMIIVTLLTFSLDKAMLIGFSIYVFGMAINGKSKDISLYLLISIFLILCSILLSIYYV